MARIDAESISPEEIARFSALADDWWRPEGAMAPLHGLNPPRLAFLRDRLCAHFGLPADGLRPLAGLRVLDAGCGGGLLSEPLARMGADVTALDASADLIAAAALHAREGGLEIDYRCASVEDMARGRRRFDAVVSMEVVEHVASLPGFLAACCRLVAADGALVLSTLNRTPRAWLEAILVAERVLRWLPPGTHDWRKFVKPAELARHLRAGGFAIREVRGLGYRPLSGDWRLTRDASVNYLAFATRA